ncbi:MAG TPA: radical SAM protein, partial [Thermoanaerobaculia bacterium]|nr:radical SAM protein [Thermoanaerobaculia bacterium]
MSYAYPSADRDRDRWILERRPARRALDPARPYAAFVENEMAESGEVVPVATIFLTNRECPWRCLMCDLWKNTLPEPAPPGAVGAQIRAALAALPPARQVKLYNAGSFFDAQAIRPEEDAGIAVLLRPFERVIVESHPALVGERCLRLRDRLAGRLEVALGLETIHPELLARLNKRMTIDDFQRAAGFLREAEIAMRAFVLVGLPWLPEAESLDWACRSTHFAFACGASAVSLIPTRAGNGALDALSASGDFAEPGLTSLEAALEFGIQLGRGRVFADLWDLERFSRCAACLPARAARLTETNLRQV